MSTMKYTRDHEWIRIDGDVAVVGITDYAQTQLGDVVYVELPTIGKRLGKGDEAAIVESVKAASDLYAPVAGTVAAVNDKLSAKPELVNSDPYGDGWILKIDMAGAAPSDLMDEAAYKKFAEGTTS